MDELDRIVVKYGGDVRVRSLRCTEQFRTMAFAQMTYRESLRDIEACLRARPRNCMAWDCAERSRNRRWPTRTNCATGACGPTSPPF